MEKRKVQGWRERGSNREQAKRGYWFSWNIWSFSCFNVTVKVHLPHTRYLLMMWCSSSLFWFGSAALLEEIHLIHSQFTELTSVKCDNCSTKVILGARWSISGVKSWDSECRSRCWRRKHTSGFIKPHLWNVFHLVESSSDAVASILFLFNQ